MIGKNIAERRKAQRMTLSELAKRSNVSKSYLSNIERNVNQNPSIAVLERISKVLNVEVNFLIGDKEEENQKKCSEWTEFVLELKKAGVKKDQIHNYKELIEFIKWKQKK
ncbi:XRE family transcriptional regulator of biofilm formation [Fictibacillus halophilus]|uniref:XRE family transcriptional regulator of biofilm formation n=1 Tax=Fictibacillus halophilus TaxID=1610490 RepID=A0ABV2LE08_9BACL|nr:helix-turn-helix transcriptional regulator [Fictibacillus halophilus]